MLNPESARQPCNSSNNEPPRVIPAIMPMYRNVANVPDATPCFSRGAAPNMAELLGAAKVPVPNPASISPRMRTIWSAAEDGIFTMNPNKRRAEVLKTIPNVGQQARPRPVGQGARDRSGNGHNERRNRHERADGGSRIFQHMVKIKGKEEQSQKEAEIIQCRSQCPKTDIPDPKEPQIEHRFRLLLFNTHKFPGGKGKKEQKHDTDRRPISRDDIEIQ